MVRQFGGSFPGQQADKTKIFAVLGVLVIVVFILVFLLSLMTKEGVSGTSAIVVSNPSIPAEPQVRMVDVLIAIQNVEAGRPLEPAMFRKESRPQNSVAARVVRDFEEIQAQYARGVIVAGQPLVRDNITNVKPANPLTVKIRPGYRAISINVSATSAVEGWARQGARVDVAWISTIGGQPSLTIIVEDAEIISAERQIDTNNQAAAAVPTTVTLLVIAEDAKKIDLAKTTGTLTLQLRGDAPPGGIGREMPSKGDKTITVGDIPGNKVERGQSEECKNRVTLGSTVFCMVDGKLKPLIAP